MVRFINPSRSSTISPSELSARLVDLHGQTALIRDLCSLLSFNTPDRKAPNADAISTDGWYGLYVVAGAMADELNTLDRDLSSRPATCSERG